MPVPVCDCRNMECPQPVLQARKLIDAERPDDFEVLVDNDAARENVTRFLSGQGYAVSYLKEAEDVWRLRAVKGEAGGAAEARASAVCPAKLAENARTLVLISASVLGSGDDALGTKLMRNFLLTLPEMGEALWRVILLNGGVQLAEQDSPALAELKTLAESGVSILVCGTCLEHFGLMEKKAVGDTTNMLDVVTSIQLADKVVRV